MTRRNSEPRISRADTLRTLQCGALFLSSILTVAVFACMFPDLSEAQPPDSREISLVKAGYVLKIPLFLEWPATQWKSAEETMKIGVLGDSRMTKYLIEIAKKSEQVPGRRKIEIKEYPNEGFTADSAPDVLFLSGSQCENPRIYLRMATRKPMMNVGDCGDFIRLGGMFRLLRKGSHLTLEANRVEIERSGLIMSFRLATVATIVTPETSAP